MIVIGHDEFGKQIADKLEADMVCFEKRIFSDNEVCPRIIDNIKDNHVVLVNRMKYPANPNNYIVENLFLLKHLREKNIEKIDFVMPYFAYCRQDKVFRKGEPHSAKYILEILKDYGVTRFFTVSSHFCRDSKMLPSPVPAYNINGFHSLVDYIKNIPLENPVIVSPDFGSSRYNEEVARLLDSETLVLEKKRDFNTGEVFMRDLNGSVYGKDIVIVDDIVASGATMIKAIDILKKSGAGRIVCAAVHPVLTKNALQNVSSKVWKFISTDTIDTPISYTSVAGKIAEKISR